MFKNTRHKKDLNRLFNGEINQCSELLFYFDAIIYIFFLFGSRNTSSNQINNRRKNLQLWVYKHVTAYKSYI